MRGRRRRTGVVSLRLENGGEEEGKYGENAPGEGIDCEAAGYADPAVSSIRRRIANFLEGQLVGEGVV